MNLLHQVREKKHLKVRLKAGPPGAIVPNSLFSTSSTLAPSKRPPTAEESTEKDLWTVNFTCVEKLRYVLARIARACTKSQHCTRGRFEMSTTAEPGRRKPYDKDLRWRIVYQRIGMNLTFHKIASNFIGGGIGGQGGRLPPPPLSVEEWRGALPPQNSSLVMS